MASKHAYTDEELAFLREVIPGHLWDEVSAMFAERFGLPLNKNQVHYVRAKLGAYAGVQGSSLQPGTTVGAATRFVIGNVPKQGQRYKVGDERTDKEGYTWVKVCESNRDPKAGNRHGKKCWRLKSHLVWEQAHGEPVPDGHAIIFANRDITDFAPENIVAVPKGVLSTMNALHMQYYDAATLEACMTLAKVRMALKAKRKGKKDERA